MNLPWNKCICVLYALVILFHTLFSAPFITYHLAAMIFERQRKEKRSEKKKLNTIKRVVRMWREECLTDVFLVLACACAILSSQNMYNGPQKYIACISCINFHFKVSWFQFLFNSLSLASFPWGGRKKNTIIVYKLAWEFHNCIKALQQKRQKEKI